MYIYIRPHNADIPIQADSLDITPELLQSAVKRPNTVFRIDMRTFVIERLVPTRFSQASGWQPSNPLVEDWRPLQWLTMFGASRKSVPAPTLPEMPTASDISKKIMVRFAKAAFQESKPVRGL